MVQRPAASPTGHSSPTCVSPEDNDDENRQIDTVEIIVAKNRHGPTGSVELGWNGEFTTFNEIDRDHDEF